MNTTLLIEALVRQTTVLIATLATATGERTPLARVANQVFADLVGELKAQGLGNRVIADMFGMALRTYHYRMARLAESKTDHGHSVWEAVLSHVQQSGEVLRADVLRRFRHDEPDLVRGVLKDLVGSGLLYRTGRGDQTAYGARRGELRASDDGTGALAQLLLVVIHRHGPLGLDELAHHVPMETVALEPLLAQLVADGRLSRLDEPTGEARYRCDDILVHYGDAEGWQAALFDHYQAVVVAMCTKLRLGRRQAARDDRVGGSTYHFDLWSGHPLQAEVEGLLGELRSRALTLCERVQAHNAQQPPIAPERYFRIIAYVGQSVAAHDEEAIQDEELEEGA